MGQRDISGVVITEEEGYSGKLEKQVRRISIAFAL
jgi:hypothetical protein